LLGERGSTFGLFPFGAGSKPSWEGNSECISKGVKFTLNTYRYLVALLVRLGTTQVRTSPEALHAVRQSDRINAHSPELAYTAAAALALFARLNARGIPNSLPCYTSFPPRCHAVVDP